MIYLDSSALVKQYYDEPGSGKIRPLFLESTMMATASLSYAEVFSALNRKLRQNVFSSEQYRRAVEAFDVDWKHLDVVPLYEEVLKRARAALENHDLRAGDAVQLASALVLAASASAPIEFASADRKLNAAAGAEGLSLLL